MHIRVRRTIGTTERFRLPSMVFTEAPRVVSWENPLSRPVEVHFLQSDETRAAARRKRLASWGGVLVASNCALKSRLDGREKQALRKKMRPSIPDPRSKHSLTTKRRALEWPEDREFRILSIDGGGIRGIFPAGVLAELEARYLGGGSVANYFDLIVGTSTGGIIALGLGAGFTAAALSHLYIADGRDIFPPSGIFARLRRARRLIAHVYDQQKLKEMLRRQLETRTMQDSSSRLCIPSCDGTHGDIWVYKTPHHPDYRMDGSWQMVDVALAASAAPTYFRPMERAGFRLLDGGFWANNPIMIGVVEALSALGAARERTRVLSIGCGSEPYKVDRWKLSVGGQFWWRDSIFGAMHYQSLAALGQARLLLGADRVDRIEPELSGPPIALDDWSRTSVELPLVAAAAVDQISEKLVSSFLDHPAAPYEPFDPHQVDSGGQEVAGCPAD